MSFLEPLVEFVSEDFAKGFVALYKPPTFDQQDAGMKLIDRMGGDDPPDPQEWRDLIEPMLHDFKVPDDVVKGDTFKEDYHASGLWRANMIDTGLKLFFRESAKRRIAEYTARVGGVQAPEPDDAPGTVDGGSRGPGSGSESAEG